MSAFGHLITCEQLIDFLHRYVDGDLPDDQRARFDEHLALCPPCVEYLESYRRTVQLGNSLAGDEPAFARNVLDELVRGVLAAIHPPRAE